LLSARSAAAVDTKQQNAYIRGMEMVPLTPERKAQLDDYAQRHGQDTAAALDDILADALEWEQQDYREAVEGIREGYADLKAGRTRPAEEVFEELRVKHGLPRLPS
jgi:predicted transcriptional regulator